jgi:hypothetical protein
MKLYGMMFLGCDMHDGVQQDVIKYEQCERRGSSDTSQEPVWDVDI